MMKNNIGMDQPNEIIEKNMISELDSVSEMKEMKVGSHMISNERTTVDSTNEGLDQLTFADNMEPITVSRKFTHGKGNTAGKRAGRVSMLLGACALTLGLTVAAPSAGAQKLEQGVRSEHVLQLQEQLSDLGYFDAGMTGYYGTITKGAVRKFQQAQGLSADGVAGPATLNRLNKRPKPRARRCASWRS